MKSLRSLPKIGAILFFIIAIASCDENFNTIGGDIIGDDDLLSKLDDSQTVISYSKNISSVQTNNIPVHQLGIYNDPVYGKATINFLTQLVLSETDPTFGDSIGQQIQLDSVILYIPFFSEEIVGEDETTYTLDSIFGNSPVNISVYESNFFLRDLDPDSNFEDPQLYYSNQGAQFDEFLGELLVTKEDFIPSDQGYILIEENEDEEGDDIETLISPGLRVELSTDFFQEKIIDKEGEPELNNNNLFKEYFRGINFKVESQTNDGSLFIFNPINANITLKYSFDRPEEDEDGNPVLDDDGVQIIERINEEYLLNFGGVSLNTYENNIPQDILGNLENPNTNEGEETLYVKGGEGIVTVIDLFGEDLDDNGIADELETLRDQAWIINDANLIFYVDQSKVEGGSTEPERMIIYDLNNNTVLVDYFLDPTSGDTPVDALNEHLGRLKRDSDKNGEYYKIKLTNHISNLINKDSTNVSLGLIVSQNVLLNGFQTIDTLSGTGNQITKIKKIPRSSVISPEGTVLYGNNTLNEEKRLKLQIYYIDPNN
jgi:hypothetical protein